jgi:hypothetical protein
LSWLYLGMRFVVFLITLCPILSFAQADTLASTILTPDQMQADFKYYRRLLEETHPGLYRYTPKDKMQIKLDSIHEQLNEPLPFYEFYKTITALVCDIRCAHTNALPTANFRTYLNSIKTLPFFVYPTQDRLFVIFNGSDDPSVTLGYELLKINGNDVSDIMVTIKRHYWGDGYDEPSKNSALQGGLFCLFYYTLIERPENFQLRFKDLQGKEYEVTVPAQKYALSEKQYIKNPINRKAVDLYNKNNKSPWRLSFPEDTNATAVLRFDGFGGKGMNDEVAAKVGIQKFMNESLKKIDKKKSKNLIVDVRSNSGGWDIQGMELFTYLMKGDKPIRYYKRLHAITNSSEFLEYSDLSADDRDNLKNELRLEADGTYSLIEDENSNLKLQYPKPNRFKGQIYVLMNERSYSTASEFLAVCKSNKVGIMVGEEAGGVYEGGNGASFIHLSLPNSKIQVGTPLVYYDNAVIPPPQKGRGAIPDYRIIGQPEDLVTGYDRQMEFVKELIRKQNEN